MKKILLAYAIFLALILTSCGSGGKNESSNSTDSNPSSACTTYMDSGYSNGSRLQFGQMPSDISLSPIAACTKGQFIFNGKCWDSIQYNDASGEVDFSNAKENVVILAPLQPFSSSVQNVMASIERLSDGVDCMLNPQSNTRAKFCTVDYQIYYDLWNYSAYSVWALQQWSWDRTQAHDGSYNNQYASGQSAISLKTTFGKCSNINTYDWYNNGTIVLNSHSFELPLSKQNFLSVYQNATNISCPYNISGWTCYSVKKTWGTQSFNFDTNKNLNSLQLNYFKL